MTSPVSFIASLPTLCYTRAMPIVAEVTTVIVPTLEGVTTVIAAFLLFCFIKPELVKNRTQFMAAFGGLVLIVLLHGLTVMAKYPALAVVAGVFTTLLQVADLILIALFCGGLSFRQFGSDVGRAYEVIRRGEEEKEVIIPLTGQQPLPRSDGPSSRSPL